MNISNLYCKERNKVKCNNKNTYCRLLCSVVPRKPKWRLVDSQMAFSKADGVSVPRTRVAPIAPMVSSVRGAA